MKNYVIIATRGRAKETGRLLDYLQKQTLQPDHVLVIGTEARDVENIDTHPLLGSSRGAALISPKIGLTAQRNFGLEALKQRGLFAPECGGFFCAFFDDDYRLAEDWLEQAQRRFERGGIVGLTGKILADGVRHGGLTEEQATGFLDGSLAPQSHWASGANECDTDSVYGCNMAFADTVVRETRFDETLPLYGWQEDRDYTGMALKLGRVIYFPGCRGVHLGVRSGRVSGIKFGYSQIANPAYLMKKKTMGYRVGIRFITRAIAVNIVRSRNEHPIVDYRGRLRGNIRAIRDMLHGRSDPRRIADSNF